MKKHIIKLLLVLVLLIDPSHFTTSSEITKESMSFDEYLKLSRQIKIMTIRGKIDRQYDAFYTNLDTMRTPKFTKKFVENLMCDALEAQSLPSISMSQAAIETGYGRYLKLKNNIFGIKGRGIKSRTKEFINGRYITIYSEFQYFKTQKHAFQRHFEIINRYGVKGDNYVDWINIIVLHGYATDPNYDKKLKYIINKFQLNRLDKIQKLNLELNELYTNDSISRI
jgi:flagellum-specific peptidoglycan hydrolase FlgJ